MRNIEALYWYIRHYLWRKIKTALVFTLDDEVIEE